MSEWLNFGYYFVFFMELQHRFCHTSSKVDKGYCCGRVKRRFARTQSKFSLTVLKSRNQGHPSVPDRRALSPRTLVALPETRITNSVGQPPALAASGRQWNFPDWLSNEASQGGLAGEGQPA